MVARAAAPSLEFKKNKPARGIIPVTLRGDGGFVMCGALDFRVYKCSNIGANMATGAFIPARVGRERTAHAGFLLGHDAKSRAAAL